MDVSILVYLIVGTCLVHGLMSKFIPEHLENKTVHRLLEPTEYLYFIITH